MKQVIIIRKDLKMSSGKIAAQASHASVQATLQSDKEKLKQWLTKGMKKAVLKVKDEEELMKYKQLADKYNLNNAVIRDAGKTEVEPGTITCIAIGPDKEEKIDKVTGKLKML